MHERWTALSKKKKLKKRPQQNTVVQVIAEKKCMLFVECLLGYLHVCVYICCIFSFMPLFCGFLFCFIQLKIFCRV